MLGRGACGDVVQCTVYVYRGGITARKSPAPSRTYLTDQLLTQRACLGVAEHRRVRGHGANAACDKYR